MDDLWPMIRPKNREIQVFVFLLPAIYCSCLPGSQDFKYCSSAEGTPASLPASEGWHLVSLLSTVFAEERGIALIKLSETLGLLFKHGGLNRDMGLNSLHNHWTETERTGEKVTANKRSQSSNRGEEHVSNFECPFSSQGTGAEPTPLLPPCPHPESGTRGVHASQACCKHSVS